MVKALAKLNLQNIRSIANIFAKVAIYINFKFCKVNTRLQINTLTKFFPKERFTAICQKSIENVIYNFFELPYLYLNKDLPHQNAIFTIKSGEEILTKVNTVPILFIAGHFGAWEVLPVFLTLKGFRGNGIYRRGRADWSEKLLQIRNFRPPFIGFPAGIKAVGEVILRFRQNEFTYLLIDQVPIKGAGEYVNFFGKQAYSTTLAAKLSKTENMLIVFVKCFRAENGYELYFEDITPKMLGNTIEKTQMINHHLESAVCANPEMYMWYYERYRNPREY